MLSYDTLHLRGRVLGRVTLALADEAAQRREENIPLTQVTGEMDLRLPLGTMARRLDLRRRLAGKTIRKLLLKRLQIDAGRASHHSRGGHVGHANAAILARSSAWSTGFTR